MTSPTDLVRSLVESEPRMMATLRHVRGASLPDSWIVAGFLRNRVWDHLHGHETATAPTDIDVVFFDPDRPASDDAGIEALLRGVAPDRPWEVVNQAWMHEYNGHAPYSDSVDSFSRWAETVSTVGVRLDEDDRVALAAPHGIADLVDMIVRPTPHPDALRDVFEKRLVEKRWQDRWPRVRIVR